MATSQLSEFIQHFCRTALVRDQAGLTDGQLLGRFIEQRDGAAFAALVRRHSPMVWGVCRRLLHQHDAEDAFQATFLVLVRKAVSVVPRERVGNWLYGVTHQTALQARRNATRRKAREKQTTEMPEPTVAEPDLGHDLEPLLDQALSRLPDTYREVIVLCDLNGKTRKEVARQLGVPEGTVGSRLARARKMLAKRLARHGLAVSAGALAVVLSEKVALAGVPIAVVTSTITAATRVAAGQAGGAGAISVKVAALTEGVLKTMLVNKLKPAIAIVLILGVMGTGATILTCHTAGQNDKKPAAEKPVEPAAKQEKEGFTAWGKEVGGLQAGLGFRPGEKRASRHGETVTLVVRVRNVGKEEVNFQYLKEFFEENPPNVTNADGKKVPPDHVLVARLRHDPEEVSLAPGKEIELASKQYQLMPVNERVKGHSGRFGPLWVGTGKVSIQYERLFGNTSAGRIKIDPDLLKLTTGKLELEITPAEAEGQKADVDEGDDRTDVEVIQGIWMLQKLEGLKQESQQAFHRGKAATVVVAGHKITFAYKEVTFTLDPTKNPKRLRWLEPRRGAEPGVFVELPGIYALEGEELKICLGTFSQYPSSFEITNAEPGRRIMTFRRKEPTAK